MTKPIKTPEQLVADRTYCIDLIKSYWSEIAATGPTEYGREMMRPLVTKELASKRRFLTTEPVPVTDLSYHDAARILWHVMRDTTGKIRSVFDMFSTLPSAQKTYYQQGVEDFYYSYRMQLPLIKRAVDLSMATNNPVAKLIEKLEPLVDTIGQKMDLPRFPYKKLSGYDRVTSPMEDAEEAVCDYFSMIDTRKADVRKTLMNDAQDLLAKRSGAAVITFLFNPPDKTEAVNMLVHSMYDIAAKSYTKGVPVETLRVKMVVRFYHAALQQLPAMLDAFGLTHDDLPRHITKPKGSSSKSGLLKDSLGFLAYGVLPIVASAKGVLDVEPSLVGLDLVVCSDNPLALSKLKRDRPTPPITPACG